MKRYLFKYQISLPTCFYYCSTELQVLTIAGMLSRDALPMDIGAKYLTLTVAFCKKLHRSLAKKTHHIRQFEKVYGMRTIISIVKADYCLMSQLLFKYIIKCHPPSLPQLFRTF